MDLIIIIIIIFFINPFQECINNGATGDYCNTYGACALFTACSRGDLESVKLLLRLNPLDLERKDALKYSTPIYYEFDRQQISVVRFLLEHKAKNPLYHWLLSSHEVDSRAREHSNYVTAEPIQNKLLKMIFDFHTSKELQKLIQQDLNAILKDNFHEDKNVKYGLAVLAKFCDKNKGPDFL